MNKNMLYRSIPKVDVLLEEKGIRRLMERYGRTIVMTIIREKTEELRKYIASCDDETVLHKKIAGLVDDIQKCVEKIYEPDMKPVINGTGTILHTNLGRAPISREHARKLEALVTGYSNLEYDLEKGKRGERYSHFERLLCMITGAEAAVAVNNNAAAVMLILSSLAKGGEVIVSRGELVEIGGKFRIPDVMEQSGAQLVEVGTTNKTHLSDYERAVTEQTKAFLKVHTSNYRIVGFTETVPVSDIKVLSEKTGIPVVEDLGSGVLVDLRKYGLSYEPTVQDSVQSGADVVCFSGDKLLGGPQAGIIVGKKKYIDLIKRNQLTRALRIDKFTAAVLEMILREYIDEEKAVRTIPVLKMIKESPGSVAARAMELKIMLEHGELAARVGIEACESQIGGGSLPLECIPSTAVTIKPDHISVTQLEEEMRNLKIPIIGRVANDMIYLDVRTIESSCFGQISEMLKVIL